MTFIYSKENVRRENVENVNENQLAKQKNGTSHQSANNLLRESCLDVLQKKKWHHREQTVNYVLMF